MVVNRNLGLIFEEGPKTASRALTRQLLALGGWKVVGKRHWSPEMLAEFAPDWTGPPLPELEWWNRVKDVRKWRRFTVVRNHWDFLWPANQPAKYPLEV